MKKKIIIKDFDGKIVEKEFNTRDIEHLRIQQKFRSAVIKPLKGKGSFRRNKRVEADY